ncbi:secreted protein containing TonB-dependent receptor, beta-barrel [gut metagenome]|uniref:Secreted protein containing TonB-dependent receptor, beta-barrel n=1 Tax=gut metagenome TaxID=749906 RepID=J9FSV6_9ZZZZ
MKQKNFPSGKHLLLSSALCMFLAANALPVNAIEADAVSVVQQTAKLKGVILDAKNGEPIIGANVLVKGTTNGTITNFDGEYELDAPAGSVLVISYIGYKPVEVKATQGKQTVKLAEDTETLDEVVVVGYTTQKKESLTGAMSTIKSDKLKDVTTPSVENMLSGKVPGVYVAPGSGQPGAGGAVVIRGQASLSGGTQPLWVIDGVIVGTSSGDLNPADIETMTVLKDAASTAIYGSEGANGVIVVTTKKGREGKININASVKMGISTVNNGKLEVMNGAELYDYYASFQNAGEIAFTRWTPELRNDNFDWWDLATQTGFTQDYHVSMSGGSDKLKGYFSLGYYDEEGAVKGYDFKRYSFRSSVNYQPFEWLTIKPSLSGSQRDIYDQQYSVTAMYSMLPWDSPYDKDGNLVPHRYSGWVNAQQTNYLLDYSYGNYGESTNYEFMGNFDFEVKITDWLKFTSVNNYRLIHASGNTYTDPRSSSGEGVKGRLYESREEVARRYTNQNLMVNKTFGKHALNGHISYEFKDYTYKSFYGNGTGFVPGFHVMDVTSLAESINGGREEWAVQSYFTNWHYTYDNKYLAEVMFRRDGASNLGTNQQYGNLYSFSAGWILSNENWFHADWVDNLKLRASYGSVGNRPSALYPQYDLYSVSANYNGEPGALISVIGNKDLTWERTYTTGIGLDASFFENRLHMVFDYYMKNTDNIIYDVPVSGLTGVTSIYKNIGKMRNTGFELSIGGDIIRTKDWNWNIEANLSHNKNELRDLYAQKQADGSYAVVPVIIDDGTDIAGTINRRLEVGEPIDTYYGKEWAGVNPDNGAPMWYMDDENGQKVTTSDYSKASYYKLGTANPKLFGGFSTSLSWKNLDLQAVFGYSLGGQIYNYSRQEYDSDGTYTDRNQMKLKDGWSRWQKPGDIATHPVAKYNNQDKGNAVSSRYLEDSDYLKLRSLTLGYTIPLKQYGIQNLRVSVSGENLFTWTDYSGVDPEIPASSGSVMGTAGPDVYPSVRKFMFGLNVTF